MMKVLMILIFILHIANALGQNVTASLGLERTVAGTESQFTAGYESKKEWSLGAFYQTKLTLSPFEMEKINSSASWYGIYLNAPLVRLTKISLYAQVRTGLLERQFIVFVPSLETKVRLTQRLSLTVGSSFRHTYPAFLLKANISLFKNQDHKRSQSVFN
ncbi:MAG: hypothetical protein ABI663_17220 [Chryseolinea sp.]